MIINKRKVISITGRYNTFQSPLKVIDESFEPYVLKFPCNLNDNSIIKEFICHFLLKSWKIPTPEIAILSVPTDLLESFKPLEKRERNIINNTICFGSKMLLNSIDMNNFLTARDLVSQRRIRNSLDLLKIALFDIWVENEDRKPTNNNLLLNPVGKSFEIYAIDHAFTFSTLDFKDIKHEDVSFSYNESILLSSLAKSIIKKQKWDDVTCSKYEEMFYLCIKDAETLFLNISDNLIANQLINSEDKTLLHNFLFNSKRNRAVIGEFFYIINSIK
ncbi:MAG: hypothetical protein PHN86_02680 [Proteiniphilum sp.]|jgi:hypothetical protein|nr:hypothetical protein [Proteiniphilum sp.]